MSKKITINSATLSFGDDEQSYKELVDAISERYIQGRASAACTCG